MPQEGSSTTAPAVVASGSGEANGEETEYFDIPLEMASNNEEKKGDDDKETFHDLYEFGKELGVGAFSSVKLGTHKKTGESYAIKVITKSEMQEFDKSALKDEIAVLSVLRHDHIIRLYGVFDETEYIYLITEKVMGGMLFDRLVAKLSYTEKEARDVCRILLQVLDYCHKNQVAHRDLKPENLLLISETDDSSLKLADFGFAKKCTGPKSLKTQCGSPRHVAPEILLNVPYDTQVDMWSLGVIMYTIMVGYPPFFEEKKKELFRKIKTAEYEFEYLYWKHISQGAKDLIASLLVVDPEKRATPAEALMNPWIVGKNQPDLSTKDLGASQGRLKAFNARQKLQGAIYAVIATRKLTSLGLNFQADLESERGGGDDEIQNGDKKETGEKEQKTEETSKSASEGPTVEVSKEASEGPTVEPSKEASEGPTEGPKEGQSDSTVSTEGTSETESKETSDKEVVTTDATATTTTTTTKEAPSKIMDEDSVEIAVVETTRKLKGPLGSTLEETECCGGNGCVCM